MTTLYRAYDAADRLLYVGIADKLVTERLLQHSSPGSFIGHWILNGDSLIGARWGGGWTDDMTTVRVKHYDDRKAAMAAESAAIRDEHPLFNRSGLRRSNAPG
jgi:GIY-YIG catalytic domain